MTRPVIRKSCARWLRKLNFCWRWRAFAIIFHLLGARRWLKRHHLLWRQVSMMLIVLKPTTEPIITHGNSTIHDSHSCSNTKALERLAYTRYIISPSLSLPRSRLPNPQLITQSDTNHVSQHSQTHNSQLKFARIQLTPIHFFPRDPHFFNRQTCSFCQNHQLNIKGPPL